MDSYQLTRVGSTGLNALRRSIATKKWLDIVSDKKWNIYCGPGAKCICAVVAAVGPSTLEWDAFLLVQCGAKSFIFSKKQSVNNVVKPRNLTTQTFKVHGPPDVQSMRSTRSTGRLSAGLSPHPRELQLFTSPSAFDHDDVIPMDCLHKARCDGLVDGGGCESECGVLESTDHAGPHHPSQRAPDYRTTVKTIYRR